MSICVVESGPLQVTPEFEETPLFWATSEGRAEAASVLISEGGADVAHRDHKGRGKKIYNSLLFSVKSGLFGVNLIFLYRKTTPSMYYNGHAITDTYSPSYRPYKRGCVNHICKAILRDTLV